MDLMQKRSELAATHYIRRGLDETLERVMLRLYAGWMSLSAEDRALLEQKRQALAEALEAGQKSVFERGNLLEGFLRDLEQIDAVVELAFDEMIQGKTREVLRSTSGPAQATQQRLVSVLRMPPAAGLESSVGLETSAQDRESPVDTNVQFYTKVDFPAKIDDDLKAEHPLIVQLVLNRPQETAVSGVLGVHFHDPQKPEMVEVVVAAPGFHERTGVWNRTIAVYSYQDSQPAIFLLSLEQTGTQTRFLTVDFYHQGRNVGSFIFKTEVGSRLFTRTAPIPTHLGNRTEQPAQNDETPLTQGTARVERAISGISLPAAPPPPVDVELRIIRADDKTLHFTLHSARAAVGYHWKSAGSIALQATDPTSFFEQYFARLNQLAARPTSLDAAEAEDYQFEVEDIGFELYKALFPEPLKREYWELHKLSRQIREQENRPLSLLVTSDEPWIPWEMVKPYEDADRDSDFLAAAFQMSRWLAGRGPAAALTINAARLVAPKLDLDFVQEERDYFQELAQKGLELGTPIGTHAELLNVAQRGGIQLLHFATHGNFDRENANQSPISLQDRPLIPRDFNKRRIAGLLQDRPIVFFNTCHGGRLGFDLTGLSGWAQQMVDEVGVTAFIGTHWEVNDQLAAIFSRSFYTTLLSGKPLGEAFHTARLTIREKQPGNPTWLAYTLYGDPNSRIELAESG